RFVAGFIGKQNFIPVTVSEVGPAGATLQSKNSVMRTDAVESMPATANTGRGAEALVAGGHVRAAIRPERMRVSESASAAGRRPNTAPCTVSSSSRLGGVAQYIVRSGTNNEILARVPAAGARLFGQGEDVSLSWDEDAVAVFADE